MIERDRRTAAELAPHTNAGICRSLSYSALLVMLAACTGVPGSGVPAVPVQVASEPSTSDTTLSLLLPGPLSGAVRPFWMKAKSQPERGGSYTDVSEFLATSIAQYRTNNRRNGAPFVECNLSKTLPVWSLARTALYVAAQIRSSGGVVTFKASGAYRSGITCGIAGPVFKDPYVNNGQLDPAIDGAILYLANSTDGIAVPAMS